MTQDEVKSVIAAIPIGAKLQLIKKNGIIADVFLASHDIGWTEQKNYGTIIVPALPPALIVHGGARFGIFRIDTDDLVHIAWVG